MPLDMNMLKLANIFSGGLAPAPYDPSNPTGFSGEKMFPSGVTPPTFGDPSLGQMGNQPLTQSPTNAPAGSPDLTSTIQQLLHPQDTQFQNFADLIQQMPQRSQYQPSKWRQIAAAIAGLGTGGPVGIAGGQVVGYKSNVPEELKVQEAIKDEPYNKALIDWTRKVEPSEKIAQMEATRNVNLRQIGLGEMARQTAQQRADTDRQREEDTARIQQQKADTAAERAKAYIQAKQFTQDHPNYKSYIDKDGMLVFVNPQDPSKEPVRTNIDTGKLNDMEKIDLQVQGRLSEIAAQSQGRSELEGVRQANRKELENVRQINRVGLKETPAPARPSSATTKPQSAADLNKSRIEKARQIISQYPELAPYVKFDKNNAGTITGVTIPPNSDRYFANLRGFKESDRMRAYNAIFGQAPVPGVSQASPQSIRKEIPGHPGKFAVSTDGGKTWKAE